MSSVKNVESEFVFTKREIKKFKKSSFIFQNMTCAEEVSRLKL